MKYFSLVISLLLVILSSQGFSQVKEAKHIILIGSDGFGAYAFGKAKAPHLRKMMKEGAYTLSARSVLPSSSADNWMSMISGSPIELHGYTEWGSQTPEVPAVVVGESGIYPTLFALLEKQKPDKKKGVAYVWGGIGYLFEKEYVDMDFNGDREKVIEKSIDFLTKEKPYFTFIHFSEPDGAGHNIGHDTPAYYAAVEEVDTAIGKIFEALKAADMLDNTLIVFSSDHGGINKGHGGKTLQEMEIPWIVWGAGLKNKRELKETIITYDTGATLAYIMGLEMPQSWRGQAQKQLFEQH